MKSEIVYYTCNTHDREIDELCRRQLLKAGLPILCVSLNEELSFGNMEVTVYGERSPEMMHRQIVAGLDAAHAENVFLCESDVYYHPSHFEIMPTERDVIYYNTNVWRVRWSDKFGVWTDDLQQVSGICANREFLLDWYTKRLAHIEAHGFDRHYEPRGVRSVNWQSREPNLCIRHGGNLTRSKWSPDEFRNPKYAKGWQVRSFAGAFE